MRGAIAGWLAMIMPALLIVPMVHFVGCKMDHPRVKSILQTIVLRKRGVVARGGHSAWTGSSDRPAYCLIQSAS
ncbi:MULTISPECIES: hypothetical protein [unclassified Bradyrhizobium]|uniref:hypothetical protein n=1 Tax=unclassified Bradyrhizobium TaxID=2631580 RepID=UPI00209E2553|nr:MULTISPECIES: hypothetical protein [unclassified Bradyrhizobium]